MPVATQEALDPASRLAFLPLSLLLSFGLFQFVCLAYFRRRRQVRVVLPTVSAFVGCAALAPLAHPNNELLRNLNSVSETCATLTLLAQIVITGRDSSNRKKEDSIRFIKQLTSIAEALATIQAVVVVVLEVLQAFLGSENVPVDLISRQASLVTRVAVLMFITSLHFYYVSALVGTRAVLSHKRAALMMCSLLVAHALPLENATGVSWEFAQGLFLCIRIVLHL